MRINVWLVLFIASMALDWLALWLYRPTINYLTKPLTLFLLMMWFWSNAGSGWVAFSFLIGFFFSLIGDAFLLLPPRYFMMGLAAFLLAHLSYLAGLAIGIDRFPLSFWILTALVMVVMFSIGQRLVGSARANPRHRRMIVPIILYACAISLMFLFALWTLFRRDWGLSAAVVTACGALLFLFSDIYLAFDRFVNPIPRARLMIRITYHLGQFALATGVILSSVGA